MFAGFAIITSWLQIGLQQESLQVIVSNNLKHNLPFVALRALVALSSSKPILINKARLSGLGTKVLFILPAILPVSQSGTTNGSEKSESPICSMSQSDATSIPPFLHSTRSSIANVNASAGLNSLPAMLIPKCDKCSANLVSITISSSG
uniref:Uncharacterized protein n=1 Tax=Glossina pallidipes TaxID=7398 RepID=A0A1A9Z3E3_GLOPL